MEYLYQAGKSNGKKFILLHGTGGDETSLVELAKILDADSTILSLRGTVKEEGMNRFFKRNGLNQFDFESLEQETDHLYEVIKQLSQEKAIALDEWTLVGYSNGANIAAHLLLERETALTKGIFFHPMSLEVHTQSFALADKNVWVSYGGGQDPIVSEASFMTLVSAFRERQANIVVAKTNHGHQITMDEVQNAREWLKG
ncbi:alpha/beta hydrolase [Enterococcus dongliensis]|uniref:alpha/beta hydrolase n=1 Tax=Enterococcus dongliensis TaxID=2559925 RepID=UPI00288EDC3A|nr:dienelactone hydrolase family protein [Enterococcus dongliensis]MDT2672910.1 dienelactone hydrolase family protein [Enterococcus dongliensis]